MKWFVLLPSAYVVVGLYVATIGPLGRDITSELRRVRSGDEWRAALAEEESSSAPPWKFAAMSVVMRLAAVLAWPVFLPGFLRSRRHEPEPDEDSDGDADSDDSLRFTRLGGEGDLKCRECGHGERLTSFLHGFGPDPWMAISYQCQSCDHLVRLEGHALGDPPPCKCGGELSRDQPLRCPACGSGRLDYEMEFIT